MLLIKFKTKCICGKEIELFNGFEEWSYVDKFVVKSLCKKCSKKVKKFIEKLKEVNNGGVLGDNL